MNLIKLNNYIKHIEHYLGTITEGESVTNEKFGKLIFSKFKNQPVKNVTTYVTLGLSNHVLRINNNKDVRMEILFSVYDEQENSCINDLLLFVSDKILISHEAILRGQVIPLPENILQNKSFSFVYVSIPIFFDKGFRTIKETNPDTVFAWIFPLYEKEAKFISEKGWNNFEDILENSDCDLWDLERTEIELK